MTLPDPVRGYLDVFQGSLDVDTFLGLFSDDVRFRDVESGRVANGRAELAKVIQPFAMLSEMSARFLRYAVADHDVFAEAELVAKTPAGDPVTSRGVIIFTVGGSRIAAITLYLFRQNVKVTGPGG